jgi:hypothetical protein
LSEADVVNKAHLGSAIGAAPKKHDIIIAAAAMHHDLGVSHIAQSGLVVRRRRGGLRLTLGGRGATAALLDLWESGLGAVTAND